MFQLVRDDGPVRVLYAVEKLKPYGEREVAAKYGIPGTGYAEYAVLRGDPSDGLPGVKGVGDKTAAALVARFGTVEGILAALDAGTEDGFPAGARAKLEAARDYLAVAPAVTRTVRDLPIPSSTTRCRGCRATRSGWSSCPTAGASTARSTACWPRSRWPTRAEPASSRPPRPGATRRPPEG
jgi:hypothetical protein